MRRSGLASMSKKRRGQLAEYRAAVAVVRERAGGRCEVPAIVASQSLMADTASTLVAAHCRGMLVAHHVWRRSQYPERVCDPEVMIWVCWEHHSLIHENPAWAKQMGLLA